MNQNISPIEPLVEDKPDQQLLVEDLGQDIVPEGPLIQPQESNSQVSEVNKSPLGQDLADICIDQ
jgi:hypothetical protein